MNARKISKALARMERSEMRGPRGPTGDAALGRIVALCRAGASNASRLGFQTIAAVGR